MGPVVVAGGAVGPEEPWPASDWTLLDLEDWLLLWIQDASSLDWCSPYPNCQLEELMSGLPGLPADIWQRVAA